MKVEELVREMERIKGWRLVDGCISVESPRTAPGFYMCPIVAVHWSKTGRQMWFTQSRLNLDLASSCPFSVVGGAQGRKGFGVSWGGKAV